MHKYNNREVLPMHLMHDFKPFILRIMIFYAATVTFTVGQVTFAGSCGNAHSGNVSTVSYTHLTLPTKA